MNYQKTSSKTQFVKISCLIILMISSSFTPSEKEEGMYPLAQLNALDLNGLGLKIPQSEIYQPGKIGLTNALVRLGGCTGSFISEDGLIITNHHCVYGSVADASTAENNYLENGFYASERANEIKTGLPCRITLSFDDVSNAVLDGVADLPKADAKKERIRENIKAIEAKEREEHPDLEIAVSEMFVGKFYTLFRYKLLKDVRLVYVPPKAVGKFGGELDNWVWPRHNGDFSVVRAYENDEPYHPDKHLQINPSGTKEDDFVFVLGYPGTTYRHAPAEFLTYQNEHILPVISSWYDERIQLLEKDAGSDPGKKLAYASTLASLHNTTKNFKGKMQGFRRTDIIQNRYDEQAKMQQFVDQDVTLKAKFGHLLPSIRKLYERRMAIADDYILLNQMYGASGVFYAAQVIADVQDDLRGSNGTDRKRWLTDKQVETGKDLKSGWRIATEDIDRGLFARLLFKVHKNGKGNADEALKILGLSNPTLNEIDIALQKVWAKSGLLSPKEGLAAYEKNPAKFLRKKGKLINIAHSINSIVSKMGLEWREVSNETDALMPALAELRELYFGGMFIPDANATLRLTYGYVRGYSPADGVYNDPYTTIEGILQKVESADNPNDLEDDYYMPKNIIEKFKTVQASDKLVHPQHKKVVVGILYNMDTTGGNSGSPILNADGELVGVNFDRAFSATINDFEWNESYSRSIGVDIRYVLYVMKYIGEADALLKELKVEL